VSYPWLCRVTMGKSHSPLMLFICQSINQVPCGVGHRNIGTGCHIPAIAAPVALPTLERHGGSFRGACFLIAAHAGPLAWSMRDLTVKSKKPLGSSFPRRNRVCQLRRRLEARGFWTHCLTVASLDRHESRFVSHLPQTLAVLWLLRLLSHLADPC
jgi:hypothetical protein